jgi:hypothetical protein
VTVKRSKQETIILKQNHITVKNDASMIGIMVGDICVSVELNVHTFFSKMNTKPSTT